MQRLLVVAADELAPHAKLAWRHPAAPPAALLSLRATAAPLAVLAAQLAALPSKEGCRHAAQAGVGCRRVAAGISVRHRQVRPVCADLSPVQPCAEAQVARQQAREPRQHSRGDEPGGRFPVFLVLLRAATTASRPALGCGAGAPCRLRDGSSGRDGEDGGLAGGEWPVGSASHGGRDGGAALGAAADDVGDLLRHLVAVASRHYRVLGAEVGAVVGGVKLVLPLEPAGVKDVDSRRVAGRVDA